MTPSSQPLDLHVVILNNYIRQHHVIVYRALARRVRKLSILLSTPMEPDRNWESNWEDLDVQVQKNWMFTANWKHSHGFNEPNFIHVPIDTIPKLRQLNPDIIFSYELGLRTLFSSVYRRFARSCPLIMVGNMSDWIERERGWARNRLRRILKSSVDYFTYNGPSCKRYLESLNIHPERMFFVPYCYDPEKSFQDEKTFCDDGIRRLVYCGALSNRKGVLPFLHALRSEMETSTIPKVRLDICGTGPQENELRQLASDKLDLIFHGNCGPDQIKSAYSQADICVFPSLADEWGLVPVEAMASGLPVLGSQLAQSVEVLCRDNETGWSYDPRIESSMRDAIRSALQTSTSDLERMSRLARESVSTISPEASATQFLNVIKSTKRTYLNSNQLVSEAAH